MFRFLIPVAQALQQRTIFVDTGPRLTFSQLTLNLINWAAASIVSVCIVLFLLGAGYWVSAAGRQEAIDTGKKHMLGALQGLAVTLGSYAILRTVLFVLYR